ncbi:YchJ family metal-binding protein [Castellaniella ginsengisoli]|uniref:YchJ family metal-binding protein n=1 Tax=Castellaniella ginsengisoli TaxID=546114 RepID=A0AB39DN37_9BURK
MKHAPDHPCPCGLPAAYADCCGRWHHGPLRLRAPDAQALMRSRYSAYVLDELDYLLQTWHPDTRPAALEPNEPGTRWLGLDVRRHERADTDHETESHRVFRRLRFLREWSHEQEQQVFPRSS